MGPSVEMLDEFIPACCWLPAVHARCASPQRWLCDFPRTPREVAQTAGDDGNTTRRRAEQDELP